MLKLYNGNCLEVMRTMQDNSVDSIVTDPPYGMSKEPNIAEVMTHWINGDDYIHKGGGFMGKSWDSFVPGPSIWKEALRVLKPGGHILCFASTRTQDLMGISLRFAGFEIKDTVQWMYGCLSEDTEILTKDGFKLCHKDILEDSVLCYNLALDNFEFHKPTHYFNYENKHTAYRIKSDLTDQIVSRNHRCLVEREGKLVFVAAETLQSKESVPILEGMCKMQYSIPNNDKRTGYKKQDMLKRMRIMFKLFKQKRKIKAARKIKENKSKLYGMWERICYIRLSFEKSKAANMLKAMQWGYTRPRMEAPCSQRTSKLEARKRARIKRKNDWRYKSIMERWVNYEESKREILESIYKICEVSCRVYRYVTKGWVCNGTQNNCRYADRSSFTDNGMCASYQSRCNRQQARESNAICNESRSQTIRTRARYTTTLAAITPVEYVGNVWCVEVPTGAFIARRNGKVFITGNSGFPKSLNIGKSTTKMIEEQLKKQGVENIEWK